MDLLASAGAAAEPLMVSSAPSPARRDSTGKRTRGGGGAGAGNGASSGEKSKANGSEGGSVTKVTASDMNLAEVTAVAALVEHSGVGRSESEKRERKRARQLDFGGNSASSSIPSAGGGADGSDDGHMSPSAAAGTLLGFSQSSPWFSESPTTPSKRKPCNCKNSKCLKLYCECFASGTYCNMSCNCQSCHNNESHHDERQNAVEATLERNPQAFRPKIASNTVTVGDEESPLHGRHTKGCHCKKSGCLKKYCECFQAGVMCSGVCKCHECKNTEESSERRALLSGIGEMNSAGTPQHRGAGSPSPPPSLVKRESLSRDAASRDVVSPLRSAATARGGGSSSAAGARAGAALALASLSSGEASVDKTRRLALEASVDGIGGGSGFLGGMLHPQMLAGGHGCGPTSALKIQQAMLSLQLTHSSRMQEMATPLTGVAPADAINVAEQCVLRKHLSDPVLFNLCRVLLLSAMKEGENGGAGGEAAVLKELADFTKKLCEIADASAQGTAQGQDAGGRDGLHGGEGSSSTGSGQGGGAGIDAHVKKQDGA